MTTRTTWWLQFLTALVLPFIVVFGAFFLALELFPGKISRVWFGWFATTTFVLAFAVLCLILWRPRRFLIARMSAGAFLAILLTFPTLYFNAHPRCGQSTRYIGTAPLPAQHAGVDANRAGHRTDCGA